MSEKKTNEVYSESTVVVIDEQFGHHAVTSCPGSGLADKNFRDEGKILVGMAGLKNPIGDPPTSFQTNYASLV